MSMQTFKKNNGTGMHVTYLPKGSSVNGTVLEEESNRVVLRPGNTVICDEGDLGVSGRKQFTQIGGNLPASDDASEKTNKTTKIDEETPKQIKVVPRPNARGFYDVVNIDNPDKPLNKKALRKKVAVEFAQKLLDNPELLEVEDEEEASKVEDKFTDMDWNDLNAELEDREMELNDEWNDEEDLRKAIREFDAGE